VEGTARALAEALDMPAAERRERFTQFHTRVQAWTARDWLNAQLADLGLDEPATMGGAWLAARTAT
jgi:trehalose-6-phosphate synthase